MENGKEVLSTKKKSRKSIDVRVEEENNPDEKKMNKNIQETNNEEKVTKSVKSKKYEITGKSLRTSFQREYAFDEVRTFVTMCNENKNYDLAADYLEEGGSVLEILKTFDTTDKKNINNITTLFSAIHILTMK